MESQCDINSDLVKRSFADTVIGTKVNAEKRTFCENRPDVITYVRGILGTRHPSGFTLRDIGMKAE